MYTNSSHFIDRTSIINKRRNHSKAFISDGARSASSVSHTALAQLLATNRVLGPHPATTPLGFALLSKLWLRHPAVARQCLATGALSRGTNVRAPCGMALRERLVRGQHAQTPEGEAGSHGKAVVALVTRLVLLGVVLEVDVRGDSGGQLARGHLKEAEVGGALETVAHDNELDFGQDETVSATVLAHHVVQVRKALEVLDLLNVALNAHSSVEAVERLDQADDTCRWLSTEDGGGRRSITGDGGNEHLLSVLGSMRSGLGGNGQLQGAVGGQRQGSVKLGQVPVGVDGVQSRLGLWVTLRAHWVGQEGLGHRAGDETSSCAARQRHER